MKRLFTVAAAVLAGWQAYGRSPPPNLCAPNSPLAPYQSKSFCQTANDLSEPILLTAAKGAAVYRLMARPSFKPAFIVRVEGKPGGGAVIAVRSWKSGGRTVHLTSALTTNEFERLQNSVNQADFWQLPTVADRSDNPDDRRNDGQNGVVTICGDGTGWVIEGIERHSYHVSYSSCLPYPRFDALAVSIVTLAQRKFPEINLAWDK